MTTYTKEELVAGADRVFHYVGQLFGYYAWIGKIAPSLEARKEGVEGHLYFTLAQNAVIDGFLINLRRLNEFFSNRPANAKKENKDDLRAYHFGFPEKGRFLDENDMTELHKRIAHSTSHAAKFGDVSFEAHQAAELALKHSFEFFGYLLKSFCTDDSKESQSMKNAAVALIALWVSWCDDIEKEKKRPSQSPEPMPLKRHGST